MNRCVLCKAYRLYFPYLCVQRNFSKKRKSYRKHLTEHTSSPGVFTKSVGISNRKRRKKKYPRVLSTRISFVQRDSILPKLSVLLLISPALRAPISPVWMTLPTFRTPSSNFFVWRQKIYLRPFQCTHPWYSQFLQVPPSRFGNVDSTYALQMRRTAITRQHVRLAIVPVQRMVHREWCAKLTWVYSCWESNEYCCKRGEHRGTDMQGKTSKREAMCSGGCFLIAITCCGACDTTNRT